jgi:hypothetical protein
MISPTPLECYNSNYTSLAASSPQIGETVCSVARAKHNNTDFCPTRHWSRSRIPAVEFAATSFHCWRAAKAAPAAATV